MILSKKDKFAILTANSDSFDKPEMLQVLSELGSRGEHTSYGGSGKHEVRAIIVGCQGLPGFEAIDNGT